MTLHDIPTRGRPRLTLRRSAQHGAGVALAILIAAAAGPGLGDPASLTAGSTSCWTPGSAPALFSWSATPGISCRDAADGGLPPSAVLPGGTAAQTTDPDPSRADPRTQITFSGSAYFGLAAVF